MIKSLEKLRGFNPLTGSWEYYNAPIINGIADEIEREIAERYMELPVDADGVPIHCGEHMRLDNGHEGEVWLIGVFDIMMSDHTCFDWAKSHHIKPRTVEDVLVDMLETAVGYSDSHTTVALGAVERYAAEIRDLLGGGGR